jgi:hypothetical protein
MPVDDACPGQTVSGHTIAVLVVLPSSFSERRSVPVSAATHVLTSLQLVGEPVRDVLAVKTMSTAVERGRPSGRIGDSTVTGAPGLSEGPPSLPVTVWGHRRAM